MPQVPYQPDPTAQPTEGGTPRVQVSTPEAAFGGTVAQSIEHLGQVTERAGTELFNRAVWLQQLQNKADADDAVSKYMAKAGELHAQFSSLQGKTAVDAYPQYIKDVQDARVNLRSGLGSPMAQKMYDTESLSTQGRIIFNGAGHAATQNKVYVAGTAQAKIDASKDYLLHHPEDDSAALQAHNQTEFEIRHTLAPVKGWGEEQTTKAIKEEQSSLILSRIIGLSRTQPARAKEMLEANKDNLFGNNLDHVDKVVTGQLHTTGARVIADKINTPPERGEDKETLKDKVARARDMAEKIAPEDPLFKSAAEDATIAKWNKIKAIKRDADYDAHEALFEAMYKMPKVATTVDELTAASPKAQQAWDNLDETHRATVRKTLASNAKGDVRWSDEGLKRWDQLKGLAANDDTDGKIEFLNTNMIGETKLPFSARRELFDLQRKVRANEGADPRIPKALGILQRWGIPGFSRMENKEDFDAFTGALQSAIIDFQEEHRRGPNANEIREIGARLTEERKKMEPNVWLPSQEMEEVTKPPIYKEEVPEKEADAIRADPMWGRIGREPTDKDVAKIYRQKLYKDQFGGKPFKPDVISGKRIPQSE